MYFVYAIVSKSGRIYVGFTEDLNKRLAEHNAGRTKSTAFYAPWKLFYSEKHDTRYGAREREKKLKSGYGKESLKKVLNSVPVAQFG